MVMDAWVKVCVCVFGVCVCLCELNSSGRCCALCHRLCISFSDGARTQRDEDPRELVQEPPGDEASATAGSDAQWCTSRRRDARVVPGESWGNNNAAHTQARMQTVAVTQTERKLRTLKQCGRYAMTHRVFF